MKLSLYKIDLPDNQVDKPLPIPFDIEISLKNDFDISSPQIKLYFENPLDAKKYNHCYIPDLNRYFFIRDIRNVAKNLLIFYLESDVLMTFKDDIKSSVARVNRNIKTGDYVSGNVDVSVLKTIDVVKSEVTLSGETIVISTIGA